MVFGLFKRPRGGTVLPGGIEVDPSGAKPGEKVLIRYNGLLAQSGADQVYLHGGFGTGAWYDVLDVPMRRAMDGTWVAEVPMHPEADRFNFCFVDSADHWDNNSGSNWSVPLEEERLW